MKAWIVGDSFSTPCVTTDIFPIDEGLPDNQVVKDTEWVKQVVENLGYNYMPELNLSMQGCSNDYILHNIDWILNTDRFDKQEDLLVIVPTAPVRFMYRAQPDSYINGKGHKFDFALNRTPHLNTAGSHTTGINIIDEYSAIYRDQDFEYYKTLSVYDKTLAFLNLYNIDYLFCNAFWCDCEYGNSITGYTPQFISFDFPRYKIGFDADLEEYNQPVENFYSNHFTHIGNNAYAKAVLEYIHERN